MKGIRLIALCVVLLACAAAVARAQSSLMTNIGGRQTLSLDGRWQTIIDPYENGFYDYRYQESPNGYFRDANASRQLGEMIARDRNRASVVLWSVANETPVSEPRNKFLRGLIEHARSLDPTRLLTAANERHYSDPNTQVVDDPLGEYLDVLGCNEYAGWYDGPPEKADRLTWKVTLEKPLVISEFGGDALYGRHGDKGQRWTEEYQRDIYEHQIAMLRRIPSLRGMSPWILTDFRSPRRPLPRIQDFYNRKGLISNRGERKQAFYVLQNFYRELSKEGK